VHVVSAWYEVALEQINSESKRTTGFALKTIFVLVVADLLVLCSGHRISAEEEKTSSVTTGLVSGVENAFYRSYVRMASHGSAGQKAALGWYTKGRQNYEKGDNKLAIVQFSNALEFDQKCMGAYAERAAAYVEMEDYKKSIEDYTHAIEQAPQEPRLHERRALVFLAMHRPEEALKDLSFCINADPKDHDSYFLRAKVNIELQKYERAVDDLSKALALRPTNSMYLETRSKALAKSGQYERAIADLNALIKVDDTDEDFYLQRADCYMRLSKTQKALSDYSECIKLSPGTAGAVYSLRAAAYDKLGLKAEAEADRSKANKKYAK
jgi:tetratricopeptide (TPR) repeat protein